MKIPVRCLLASVLLLALSCDGEPPVEEPEAPRSVSMVADPSLVSGEMIVEFSEEMTALVEAGQGVATRSDALNGALEAAGVTSMERLYPDAGEWEPRHRAAGLHRWYRLRYDPKASTPTRASADLSSVEGVLYTEPVRKVRNTSYFNDPYLGDQWQYFNDGSKGSSYTAGADINVVPVWQRYTTGDRSVIVAVCDTGMDMGHEDFSLVGGGSVCIAPGVDGSRCFVSGYQGYTIYPESHATHVAGTIAAVNGNGIGVCGIAGGSDGQGGVRILLCQIMRTDPNDPSKTLSGDSHGAMVWGADHGAVISQNSWGYVYDTESEAASGTVGSMGPAIEYFIRYAGCDKDGNQRPDSPMKGGVVIFSAGNESWQHAWPAEYESVIAVGATNAKNGRASYSNHGDWVDIAAPGGDSRADSGILSTLPDNKYGSLQGTSMACPHVSGVAALIVSHFGGPGFTNEMLKERLLGGANRNALPASANIGPLVDALGSFTYGGTIAPEPVGDFTVGAKSNHLTVTWKATADEDDGVAYAYRVMVSRNASDFENLNPRNLPQSVKWVARESGSAQVGDTLSVTFSNLEFDTDYAVALLAYDYCNNFSALSPVRTAHTLANNAPVVTTDYAGDYRVKSFEILDVNFSISDPDGHDFTVAVEPGSEAFSYRTSQTGSVTVRITGKAAPAGKYTAHIIARDQFGATTDYPVNYELLVNHPPRVVRPMDNLLLTRLGESHAYNLQDYFSDEDGERLQYDVTQTAEGVAHVNPDLDNLQVTALSYGLTEVTVTASDARNETASFSFKLLVRDASVEYQVYPNPVVGTLYVATGPEAEATEVTIVSSTGARVFHETVTASAFDPAAFDVSALPPGRYAIDVAYGGRQFHQALVKK